MEKHSPLNCRVSVTNLSVGLFVSSYDSVHSGSSVVVISLLSTIVSCVVVSSQSIVVS